MAMTSTERVRLHRERKRAALAGSGGPDLFGFVPPARSTCDSGAPPADPEIERRRAANREAQRRHRARKKALWSWPQTDPVVPDVDLVLEFLGSLKLSGGRFDGENLRVLPWMEKFLRGALAEGVKESALSMARGNAKTAFLAGVLAATLVGPLRQPKGRFQLVAASLQQARIAHDFLFDFMEPWFEDRPDIWRTQNSTQSALVERKDTGARVRAISSDPAKAHGLSGSFLGDEPASWAKNTAPRMLAAIRTALGKAPGSRFFLVGTRPAEPEHFFERALEGNGGPGTFAMRFAASPDGDDFDPAEWARANPSMNYFPDLADDIRSQAERARHDSTRRHEFRAYVLNRGVSDTQTALLLDAGVWEAAETDEAGCAGDTCWGLDIGGSAAMTAAACFWVDTGRLESVAFFPGRPSLADRGRADNVADLYERMASRGELAISGTDAIDLPDVLAQLRERWGTPRAIVADRWRADSLCEALRRAGFRGGRGSLIFRGMGYREGSEDLAAFRAAVVGGHVRPVPSLLLRAGFAAARVAVDTSGREKLAKSTQGGRRAKARDDSIAAAILAVALGSREIEIRAGRRAA